MDRQLDTRDRSDSSPAYIVPIALPRVPGCQRTRRAHDIPSAAGLIRQAKSELNVGPELDYTRLICHSAGSEAVVQNVAASVGGSASERS